MARCFPFPPPGYLKEIPDKALIESIKLEVETAQNKRKDKNRREKKEKRHVKENEDVENKRHKHKRKRKEERSKKDSLRTTYEKKRKDEVICLDSSSLTEEHGQPAISENSTDSTNKRHNLTGSIIRIKLSSQRQKDSKVLPIDHHTSALGRTKIDDASHRILHSEHCSTSGNVGPEQSIRPNKTKPSPSAIVPQIPNLTDFAEPSSNFCASCPSAFTPGNIGPAKRQPSASAIVSEIPNPKDCAKPLPSNFLASCPSAFPPGKVGPTKSEPSSSAIVFQIPNFKDCGKPPSNLRASSPPAFDLDYRGLMIRPSLELEDNDSWLFGTKKDQNRKSIKNEDSARFKSPNDRSSRGFPIRYPRAQYLHEASIYALPYVLPY